MTILSESVLSSTLEPDRSSICTPNALNIASISSHLTSTGVGLAKIRFRVRRCFLRIGKDIVP